MLGNIRFALLNCVKIILRAKRERVERKFSYLRDVRMYREEISNINDRVYLNSDNHIQLCVLCILHN